MAEMNDIVKLAVDAHNGNVEKYSTGDANKVLREALIELNGGSSVLNYKNIRDGKCNGLFALVEEILANTVAEGFAGDEYFNSLIDFRNVALGDKPIFEVEDEDLFVVAKAADGTQGIRRQRLGDVREVEIPTEFRVVRIYEELNRVLAGRVDFNHMIDKVGESFRQQLLNDIYGVWAAASQADLGSAFYYNVTGTYDEDALLDMIAHVEAASGGKTATILGTAKALRELQESIQAEVAKTELHNMGYYGKFFGTPCVKIPQRHIVGTTTFMFPDDVLTVVATGEKPIKCVYEGDPIVFQRDPIMQADLTMEYFFGEKYGVGLLVGKNGGIGRYEW